jgi:hypothetical protein
MLENRAVVFRSEKIPERRGPGFETFEIRARAIAATTTSTTAATMGLTLVNSKCIAFSYAGSSATAVR